MAGRGKGVPCPAAERRREAVKSGPLHPVTPDSCGVHRSSQAASHGLAQQRMPEQVRHDDNDDGFPLRGSMDQNPVSPPLHISVCPLI
jgi:hypothetical protein